MVPELIRISPLVSSPPISIDNFRYTPQIHPPEQVQMIQEMV